MTLENSIEKAVGSLNDNAKKYFEMTGVIQQDLNKVKSEVISFENRFKQAEYKHEQELQKWVITDTITLNVGPSQKYKSIREAWNQIKDSYIKGHVTIKVDDGIYEAHSIYLGHQSTANRISIIGNVSDPSKCILKFAKGSDGHSHGVVVENCWNLKFSGFKIMSDDRDKNHRGLLVHKNSYVWSQPSSLIFEDCNTAIAVGTSSILSADRLRVSNCNYGVNCNRSSQVHIYNSILKGLGRSKGTGVSADDNGQVWISRGKVSNFYNGYRSSRNSSLICDQSEASDCHVGFRSNWGGILWNHGNDSQHGKAINCIIGFLSSYNSTLLCYHARAINCEYSYYSQAASYLNAHKSGSTGAKIVAYNLGRNSYLTASHSKAYQSGNKRLTVNNSGISQNLYIS